MARKSKKNKSNSKQQFIPIRPEDGLYLRSTRDCDETRFVRLFVETWERIPASIRTRLVERWQFNLEHRRQWHGEVSPVPEIEVLASRASWSTGPSGMAFAQCHGEGLRFSFWAELFEMLPDEAAQVFIAHELGHAVLWDLDENHGFDPRREQKVDALLRKWGFNPRAFDRWISTNITRLPRHPALEHSPGRQATRVKLT